MNWKEPIVENIATIDLTFYSEEHKETCERICELLGIDIFPDIDGKSYWFIKDGSFQKEPISEKQKVNSNSRVFDSEVLANLNAAPSNILFVFEKDQLVGILHFSDYDSLNIFSSLYDKFYYIESTLRSLLKNLGESNISIRDYYQDRQSEGLYKKAQSALDKDLPDFHSFDFSDLINMSCSTKLIKLNTVEKIGLKSLFKEYRSRNQAEQKNINACREITDLRNTVMHFKSPSGETTSSFYSKDGFTQFIRKVRVFKDTFEHIRATKQEFALEDHKFMNKIKISHIDVLDDDLLKRVFFKRV
jgi:hypothetical protein